MPLGLYFVDYDISSYEKAFRLFLSNARRVMLRPLNKTALEFYGKVVNDGVNISFFALSSEIEESLPQGINVVESPQEADTHVLFFGDAEKLSSVLMEYIDLENGCIIAPKTGHYFLNRQHYVITIPKSGTHLLFRLLSLFGIGQNHNPPNVESPGTWNWCSGRDTHTQCEKFLSSIPWDKQEGRDHPFFHSPAVFMYRNPLDVIVSESNYMKIYDKTPFSYIFNNIEPSKVISNLISSSVVGTIADRFLPYVYWLYFPNVIPVSFEELIGPEGGGDFEAQTKVVWSLQLKLHVSGEPGSYAKNVFDSQSPTFFAGQIGSHRHTFTDTDYAIFKKLCRRTKVLNNIDLIGEFGYDIGTISIPKHAHKFRHKPLRIHTLPEVKKVPLLVGEYKGYNLVEYNNVSYGIPQSLGAADITKEKDRNRPGIIKAKKRSEVEDQIDNK